MKRIISTLLFGISLFFVSTTLTQAQYIVFDPSAQGTRIIQLAKEIISAGADVATQINTFLTTTKLTILDPLGNSLINIAMQQAANDIVNWANGGFSGNSLIISDPIKFVEDKGLQAVKAGIENIPEDSIYGQSILSSIISTYKTSSASKIASLSQSNIPSLVQNNICNDATLSDLAKDGVVETDGSYDPAAYATYKKTLNDTLCVGDPNTDPKLAKTLLAVNTEQPSLGGWDTWLAKTGGDNDYTTSVRVQEEFAQRAAEAKEQARNELLAGKGNANQEVCIEYSSIDDTCIKSQVVAPSGIVADSLSAAATAGLHRLENIQGEGALSNLLSGFTASFLGKGLNSAVSKLLDSPTTVSTSKAAKKPAVEDLAGDTTTKDNTIRPIEKQLKNHLSTLDSLASVEQSFLAELSAYRVHMEEIRGCFNDIVSTYPSASSDPRVAAANTFYNEKKSSVDALQQKISTESGLIDSTKQLVTDTQTAIEASNSTEQILLLFNEYQDAIDTGGLPSYVAGAQREAEYQTFKYDAQADLSGNGIITSLRNQCATMRQQFEIYNSGGSNI